MDGESVHVDRVPLAAGRLVPVTRISRVCVPAATVAAQVTRAFWTLNSSLAL